MRRLKQYLERDYVTRKASAVYQSRARCNSRSVCTAGRRSIYPSIALLSLCIKLFRTPLLRELGMCAPTCQLLQPLLPRSRLSRHINPSSSSSSRLALAGSRALGCIAKSISKGGGLAASADASPGRRRGGGAASKGAARRGRGWFQEG